MNIIAKQWISTTAFGYVREMTFPDFKDRTIFLDYL
jgi:hypothetical protein